MEKDKFITKVIFRYWFPSCEDFEWEPKSFDWRPPKSVENRARREDKGIIIALFPEIPADYDGKYIESYIHVGQHGGASYHNVIKTSVKATPKEYARLKAELESKGYNLKVYQKQTPQMGREFDAEMKRQRR